MRLLPFNKSMGLNARSSQEKRGQMTGGMHKAAPSGQVGRQKAENPQSVQARLRNTSRGGFSQKTQLCGLELFQIWNNAMKQQNALYRRHLDVRLESDKRTISCQCLKSSLPGRCVEYLTTYSDVEFLTNCTVETKVDTFSSLQKIQS
jgi:hypothetical protein